MSPSQYCSSLMLRSQFASISALLYTPYPALKWWPDLTCMQLQCVVYEVADDYQQTLAAKRCYTGIIPQGLLCCALERWAKNFH